MDPTLLPDPASRSGIGSFYSWLLNQKRYDINRLAMQDYPTWAKRVVHAERKRYKDKGTDRPTKADKKKVLDFGEGVGSQSPQPNDNQQGSVDSSQQPPTELEEEKKKEKGPGQGEYDAEYLHMHVAEKATYDIIYDKNLPRHTRPYRLQNFWGHFVCKTEECEEKEWISAIIASRLVFSRSDNSYKVILHAQKCRQCERYAKPIVDPEAYAQRVVFVLDLWLGLRERIESTESGLKTRGPHDINRCHGCAVGECKNALEE